MIVGSFTVLRPARLARCDLPVSFVTKVRSRGLRRGRDASREPVQLGECCLSVSREPADDLACREDVVHHAHRRACP
jgi:hypothetical protein